MAVEALRASVSGPRVHFVANVDGHDFELVTRGLDPKPRLLGRKQDFYYSRNHDECPNRGHGLLKRSAKTTWGTLWALSTNADAVQAFGIDPDRMFGS